MAFDPNQPFEVLDGPDEKRPPFDPTKPFEPVTGIPTTPKPAFDPAQPFEPVSAKIENPAAHAAANPHAEEVAFQEYQAQKARPLGAKAGEFVQTVADPETWLNAGKGVVNFFRGFGDVAQRAVGMGDPLTRQAENTLTAQRAEESGKHLIDATIGRAAAEVMKTADVDPARTQWRESFVKRNPMKYSPEKLAELKAGWETEDAAEKKLRDEQIDRRVFAMRVQQAKNESQLAQGRPLDTGIVSKIYDVAGQKPSEEVGPDVLKAYGAPAADLDAVNRMSTSVDPSNLALAVAPSIPGAATVAGATTQAAGKLLQVPGKVISAIPGRLGRISRGAAGGAAAFEAMANPILTAKAAATVAGAKGLQAVGRVLESQGKELRTGLPSDLTTKAATAAAKGESAILTNTARKAADSAAGGLQTAVGMAPLNLALSEGDPRAFAELQVGAGMFGGAFKSLQANRAALVEGVRPHLRSEGARAMAEAGEGNDTMARKSASYLFSLPEEARDRALESIGALQGLPVDTTTGTKRAKVYVLSSPDYLAAQAQVIPGQQAAMGGGRGFFYGPDGAAYINGDFHAGLGPEELSHTIGHEFGGHAAVNIMRAAGEKGGALYEGLIGSAKKALMPGGKPTPQFQNFIRGYNRAFDPTGKTERLSVDDPAAMEEFIAEQAGQIISGRGAGELAVPKGIQDRISDGIGRFMGAMLGMDSREVGTPTKFGREEVGALTKTVQDTLSQVVGMKLRGGAEIPEPAKSDVTRMAELQAIIDTPRPRRGSPVEAVREWVSARREAQRELTELQPEQTAAFPASGAPPRAPSRPIAPNTSIPGLDPIPPVPDGPLAPILKPKLPPAAKLETPTPESVTVPTNETAAAEQTPTPDIPGLDAQPVAVSERPVDQAEPAALSPADVQRLALQTEEAVRASRTNRHKAETLPKAITDAQVDALSEAHDANLPENYQGVRIRVDQTGKRTIGGTFNPSRPFDAFLLKLADLSESAVGNLMAIQKRIGQTVTVNYSHAPEKEGRATGEGRREAQRASTAQQRAAGEAETQAQDKNFIPLEVRFNKGKDTPSITVIGASPEKLLNNFNLAREAVTELGGDVPYRDIHDPRLVGDMKGVARNHANGWKGDGSARIEGFPDAPAPTPDEGYKPYSIPQDRFDFLNLILGDESAKTGVRGQSPEQKLKQGLAAKNRIPMTDAGEVNLLRESINQAKGEIEGRDGKPTTWSRATLENPLSEALRVDLINEVKPEVSNEDASIRSHGYLGDIGRFFADGSPDRTYTAAGFMPSDTVAQHPVELSKRDAREGYKLVNVDRGALESAWSKDPMYIDPQWSGEIKGRRERLLEWLEKHPEKPLEAGSITVDKDGTVSFSNGRHRTRLLMESRQDVPVAIEAESMDNARAAGLIPPGDHSIPGLDDVGFMPGEPQTMFTASRGDYAENPKPPFYVASTEDYARNFGDNIRSFKVQPKKPLDLTDIAADADDGGAKLKSLLKKAGVKVDDLKIYSDDELAQALNRNLKEVSARLKSAGFDSVRLNEYVHGGGIDETMLVLDSGIVR